MLVCLHYWLSWSVVNVFSECWPCPWHTKLTHKLMGWQVIEGVCLNCKIVHWPFGMFWIDLLIFPLPWFHHAFAQISILYAVVCWEISVRYSQIKHFIYFPVVVCNPVLVHWSVIRIVNLQTRHGCVGIYRNGVYCLMKLVGACGRKCFLNVW